VILGQLSQIAGRRKGMVAAAATRIVRDSAVGYGKGLPLVVVGAF